MQRQELLSSRRGVRYDVVLEEGALRRAPGGERDVMAAQLDHLAGAMEEGWVDLRIRAPESGKTFSTSSFVLYDFREGPPVVLIEAHAADLYLSTPEDVAAHDKLFKSLNREALDRDASRALVESMRR
jgi:hypothetical protein